MYFTYQLIKKIFKLIRIIGSEESPTKVSLGMVVGFFWGLIPITQPISWILFFFLMVFKISLRGALLMSFPIWFLSYLIAPLTKKIGEAVLTNEELEPLFEGLYNSYFILTNFNDTYLMGAVVIGLVAALPLFFLARKGIVLYREKMQKKLVASSFYQKFLSKIWFVKEIITGEQDEDVLLGKEAEKDKDAKPAKAIKGRKKTEKVVKAETVKKEKVEKIKPKKSKTSFNPFELKYFIPIVILLAGWLGFITFFDPTLKGILEDQASNYNQATVRIDDLTTYFTDSRLEIEGLQWVDQSDQKQYLFEFNKFVGDAFFFPLLQKRVVVKEVSLHGLDFNTINPYYVPPATPATPRTPDTTQTSVQKEPTESDTSQPKTKPSSPESTTLSDQPNENQKQEDQGRIDQELQSVTDSVNQQIAEEKAKTEKEVADLKAKYQQRFQQVKGLNPDKELQELRKINISGINDVASATKALNQLKSAKDAYKKAEEALKIYNQIEKDIQSDQKSLTKKIDLIKNWEKEGEKRLLRTLKLEGFSGEAIFQRILGEEIGRELTEALVLYYKYKHLLPFGKSEQEKELAATGIKEGKVIHYRNHYNYPTFLVQTMQMSGNSEKNGVVRGVLKNISSDLTYKPFEISLSLRKDAYLVHLDGMVELEEAGLYLHQKIGSDPFPLQSILKVSPNPYLAGVRKGNTTLSGELYDREEDQTFKLNLFIEASDVAFDIKQNINPTIRKTLEKELGNLKRLTVKINYQKKKDAITLKVVSNLDKILEKTMNTFFKQLLEDQKKNLKKMYQQEIAKIDKSWLKGVGNTDFLDDPDQVIKKIQNYEKEYQRLEREINGFKKREEDKLKKEIEERAKKEGQKALEKIKSFF